ncbi:hypothetical protein Pla52o_34220 [Novipirellula galeiformis]|uniref:Uncharacterized protein n=1 Tax=Novipirellula galeiformis TaxID=2528004 RepID=A0A5C6CGJ7_9BACT|nr:hypothetical protein Pla52o_34220 [Novipirellula galeiformis]
MRVVFGNRIFSSNNRFDCVAVKTPPAVNANQDASIAAQMARLARRLAPVGRGWKKQNEQCHDHRNDAPFRFRWVAKTHERLPAQRKVFTTPAPNEAKECRIAKHCTNGSPLEQRARVCRCLHRRRTSPKRLTFMAGRFSNGERPSVKPCCATFYSEGVSFGGSASVASQSRKRRPFIAR